MKNPRVRRRYPAPWLPLSWLLQPGPLALITLLVLCSLPFLARAFVKAESSVPTDQPIQLARLSERVSVQAAGRGNPVVNLSDGHDLLTSYVGPEQLLMALEQNQAEPLSLASADFDEDGVPDLVSGYSYNEQGIVTLLRGNVDSIYPNAPEAKQRKATGTFTDAPFLFPAAVFNSPVAADFIGAGDFDGDSHWDVVTASRTRGSLFLFSGDGHGGFAPSQEIVLPGAVTAMTTGEINRADGLADLIVGVKTERGAEALVFEGPNGALKGQPEAFPMTGTVTALAVGQLDNSYEMDLAIAAGDQLLVMRGRDRKLSLDNAEQQKVLPARTEARPIGEAIKSIVIGDFADDHQPALALLTEGGQVKVLAANGAKPASKTATLRSWQLHSLSVGSLAQPNALERTRMSNMAGDDLLVLDESGLRLLSNTAQADAVKTTMEAPSPPVAALAMRLNGDASTDLVFLQKGKSAAGVIHTEAAQTFVVNSTADTNDGACTTAVNGCTLREAINAANANAGVDRINFNIPGVVPFTISPTSRLPVITESVTIDATSQPGFSGAPVIEINGANAGAGNFGFGLEAAGNTIRGLVINRFGAPGIYVTTINGSHIVEGNYIGTNISGTAAAPNGVSGIQFDSGDNVIGGTVVAARNIIAGNKGPAIFMPDPHCINNLIQGNFIGTDVTGQMVVGGHGIHISSNGARNNTVGGTTAQARNIISTGGGADVVETIAIDIGGRAAGNLVQGNYVGTDVTGTVALGNGSGVSMNDSPDNTVGGTVSSARNIFSASYYAGVFLYHPLAVNNLVQGNYIGTDVTGTKPLGNRTNGVGMGGCNRNTIGGAVPGAGNLISDNLNGVHLYFADVTNNNNTVQGNLIGTNVTGAVALGNRAAGVNIQNANDNLIGGNTPGARNVISGNLESGVAFYGGPTGQGAPGSANNNRIEGNFIGTNAAGTAKLGNARDGIAITITQGSAANTIGGATSDRRNLISGNGRNGIFIGIRLIDPLTGQLLPGTGGTGITIRNNYVGTDVTGNNCLGNTQDGVFVDADSQINTISDNLITCNGRNGVFIPQNANPGVRIFIDNNSVFANSALGIDLGNAGITANDPLDVDAGANLQQNFPVLTSVTGSTNVEAINPGDHDPEATVTVKGSLNSAPNTAFTLHWYFSVDAQCVTNQQTSRPLVTGKVPNVTTNANGDAQFNFPLDLPVSVNNGIVNCTATDPQGNTSEFSACLVVNAASSQTPSVQFDAASYSASENIGSKTVTVTRTGNTSSAATVNYTTSDAAGVNSCGHLNSGYASSRCDYETTMGTVTFAAGETSRTVAIPIIDDSYGEGNENFSFSLSNAAGASLGTPSGATVTITDNETVNGTNPLDQARYYVRVHYTDFLNREPDTGGWDFWSNQIASCGSNAGCIEVTRINVSASFFLSIEFQQTGYLVERVYKVGYGDADATSTYPTPHSLKVPVVRFGEFLGDSQQITRGVVVLQTGWEQQLESNKVAFFGEFVQRTRFTNALPTTMTPAQFVDQLNQNAGNVLTASERTTAINLFGGAGNTTNQTARAQALRQVTEDPDLVSAEFNRAFVLMQFFGYLRRNPDDPQDSDYTGYDFWLVKLNQFGGSYTNAEMVKAFITSIEYGRRFGP